MNHQPTALSVYEITRSPFAIAVEDGTRISELVLRELREGRSVCLSFAGISVTMGVFFNSIIAPLASLYSQEDLSELLTLDDISMDDKRRFEISRANMYRYLENPEKYDAAWAEVMDEVE
jgi:hypothetical protein